MRDFSLKTQFLKTFLKAVIARSGFCATWQSLHLLIAISGVAIASSKTPRNDGAREIFKNF
ncbi:MAG TPA: hypothetical protein VEC36_03295 [Patescibacteria group bacterium]|nr:hypothetical protein [Patescibacteria group bacterium]